MLGKIFKGNLLGIFILWRLILFAPLLIGTYLLPVSPSSPASYIYNYINTQNSSFNSTFLFPWANFDGIHYLNIAGYGYTNQARFFPLLPISINILSAPFIPIFNSPLTIFFISFLFVNLVFILALWIFKKLIELDFSKEISNRSIYYLLFFPTSFFFVSTYSEGLFLLLTLLAFYFARKKKWFLSIIFAMLLMTTRFVGIAILPALLYEFFISEGIKVKKLALFLLAPLGLVIYSLFNYGKWHNFFYFIQAQGELGNNRTVSQVILFPQTIYRYMKIFLTAPISYEWGIALLELLSFVLVAFLLYFAWKKRIRASYLIFALTNFAITASTGTFSSLPRYVITIFPIFIALALIQNKLFRLSYIIIAPALLFVLLMLFSRGYFVA